MSHGFHQPSNQQNVKEEEEEDDVSSGSSITGGSSDEWNTGTDEWTDEDDEEMSSKNADDEADKADEETSIMNEADKANQVNDATSEGRPCVPHKGEDSDSYIDKLEEDFKSKRPSLHDWIRSWPEESTSASGWGWLDVYGYYNKEKDYGGYGVILRNDSVQPIIAATCFTKGGQSRLLQVFNGLKTGLELAVKHQCLRLDVSCNVRRAVDLLGWESFQDAGACECDASRGHDITDGICLTCTNCGVMLEETTLQALIPVMKDLKVLHRELVESDFNFSRSPRYAIEAAHYLAKEEKRKGREVSCKMIKPDDFPPKLKEILWNDAFNCDTKYSLSLLLD